MEVKKIDKVLAISEVEAWLDKKKVFDNAREARKEHIESLQAAIENGYLILNKETWEFTQILMEPVLNDDQSTALSELKFKPRLQLKELQPYLKGVASDDGDGRLRAYVCALTKTNSGLIMKMETSDYRISTAIAFFFL